MRTTPKHVAPKKVKTSATVNNIVSDSLHLAARAAVDSLSPQITPVIDRVIHTAADAALVSAWHRYGSTSPTGPQVAGTLRSRRDHLSTLGQACILALALGVLRLPLPGGLQSTCPLDQNAP